MGWCCLSIIKIVKTTIEVVNVNLFLTVAYIASDGPESAPFLVMNFVVPARGGGIHPSTSTINYIPYMPPPPPHTLKKNGLRKNEDFQREKKHVMIFSCRSVYFMEN